MKLLLILKAFLFIISNHSYAQISCSKDFKFDLHTNSTKQAEKEKKIKKVDGAYFSIQERKLIICKKTKVIKKLSVSSLGKIDLKVKKRFGRSGLLKNHTNRLWITISVASSQKSPLVFSQKCRSKDCSDSMQNFSALDYQINLLKKPLSPVLSTDSLKSFKIFKQISASQIYIGSSGERLVPSQSIVKKGTEVYRGMALSEKEAFETLKSGLYSPILFSIKAGHKSKLSYALTNLELHQSAIGDGSSTPTSLFVSTSTELDQALIYARSGVVFVISAPLNKGIDMNKALGSKSAYSHEKEVVIVGWVEPRYIKGFWKIGKNKKDKKFYENKKFRP